jgi:hypothetical protein
MASKFLVPVQLPEIQGTPSSPGAGFKKIYLKDGFAKIMDSAGVQRDLVLDRVLTNLTIPATATAIVSTDTVLTSLAKLQKSLNSIALVGDVAGTAAYNSTTGRLEIQATVQPNSVALGTDTTGDYVAGISSDTGIDVLGSGGEGSTPSVKLRGADTLTPDKLIKWDGAAQQVVDSIIDDDGTTASVRGALSTDGGATVNGALQVNSTANITGNTQVGGNLRVIGNLQVDGTVTTVNSETVTIADNIMLLNSNVTGAPTENAGIEIERGTAANVQILWNEASDKWTLTEDGSEYHDILSTNPASVEFIQDSALGAITAGVGIVVTYNDASNTLEVKHADTSSVANTANSSTRVIQNLTFDTFGHVQTVSSVALKHTGLIGDGSNVAFTVDHNKGEEHVIVQLYTTALPSEQVECEVVLINANQVLLRFVDAPAPGEFTVVVI